MSLRPRAAVLAVVALLTSGLATAAPAPAGAATGSAPVTAPDRVTVTPDEPQEVDLLANDTDPDGDELDICRLGRLPRGIEIDTATVAEEPSGATEEVTYVFTTRANPGTYEITYYACDYSYLTPGTLTVVVERTPPPSVRVTKLPNRPGKLWIANRARHRMHLVWGSVEAERRSDLDGDIVIAAGKSRVISVRRRSLVWSAFNLKENDFAFGIVRGIEIPPGVDELPPGVPPGLSLRLAGRAAATWR